MLDQIEQGDRVAGTAPDVVDAARRSGTCRCGVERVEQVVYVEHVAHLLAVAIDAQRKSELTGDDEPRDPALILHPKLTRAVDARLPKDHRVEPVDAMVVAHVLIGRALGASVGRMKIEAMVLGNTMRQV